ncbi:MAG: YafY family transcriptional regulator [Pelosinus sp.]|nr:YafY family transcriptional regulator [Pelosinus sp.]
MVMLYTISEVIVLQISRLFEIVYMLLGKRITTAKELAEHFEVSTRTIYRDIDKLSSAGIPIYASQGKGGGISLLEDFIFNKSLLSEREQNEILIALQSLTVTDYPDIDLVLTKLSTLFKKDKSNWIEVDFSPWGSTRNQKEKFNILKNAIINRQVITFEYFNSSGIKSTRRVEPVKLIFKDKSWYLQGFCLSIEKYRTFKMGRMVNVKVTEEFYLQRSLDDFPIDTQEEHMLIDIQLKISSQGAYRVYDEFEESDVVKSEDGSFTVTTSIPEGEWLFSYLLSFGTAVEIVEPKSLRSEFETRLEMMLKKYNTKS